MCIWHHTHYSVESVTERVTTDPHCLQFVEEVVVLSKLEQHTLGIDIDSTPMVWSTTPAFGTGHSPGRERFLPGWTIHNEEFESVTPTSLDWKGRAGEFDITLTQGVSTSIHAHYRWTVPMGICIRKDWEGMSWYAVIERGWRVGDPCPLGVCRDLLNWVFLGTLRITWQSWWEGGNCGHRHFRVDSFG